MSAWIVPAEAVSHQRAASDPATSAWVSAHAGSGKTHVLSQRVVRLLLEGVAPARILCLTFTKAAAANMSLRVFDTLAAWTRLNDDDLRREIAKTGAAAGDLDEARRLFARAVETPGGLKIQTIHAFCERLLHLFPFEANVAASFEVLTDELRQELLERAREETLGEAMSAPDTRLARALRLVASLTTASTFGDLLNAALREREAILATARRQEGETLDALRTTLGAPALSAAQIEASIAGGGIPESEWETLANLIATGSANDVKCANRIRKAMAAPADRKGAEWLRVFFTKKNEPYKNVVTKKLQDATSIGPLLAAEQERLVAAQAQHRAALAAERSDALATLACEIIGRYARMKQARGLLDFDDLIERAKSLLSRSDAAQWVLYKLDAGFDHILVDEAQDTSQDQWTILEQLTDEFFAGDGASRRARTFFAVGDEKQSIFSFQGADVDLFSAKRRAFENRAHSAGAPFKPVRLKMSFRSAKGLLAEVDRIFEHAGHARGVIDMHERWMPHEAWKSTLPGLVEVWDPVAPTKREDPKDWTLPLDRADDSAPPVTLARRIAKVVAGWIAPGSREAVHGKTGAMRPVRPGDVLVLVRKRGPFFDAVIRALKDAGVPVAGADRLELTTHLAVLDLIAAGRAALLPRDDLTLACVLKSPLIGLTENDILDLAPGRRGSLWQALRESPDPRHQAAVTRVIGWRKHAGDTPFRFYARILGAQGGRAALLSRLGPEAADAADEFLKQALDAEAMGPPSLVGFLHAMENSQQSIKRDMEAASDAVRVMTVHASKGLEAPIVFLPDTCGAPSGRHDPEIVDVTDPRGERLLVWRKGKAGDPECVAKRIEDERTQEENEHRRLLYVALTRAEERLYVCGYHGVQKPKEGCWHAMVEAGLADVVEDAPAPWGGDERVRRRGEPALLDAPAGSATPAHAADALPAWLLAPAPFERPPEPPITPSTALAAADQADEAGEHGRDPLAQAGEGLRIGALTHTLLQHLPEIAPEGRTEAAHRFLAARAGDLAPERRGALAARAMAVVNDPDLAALFGPGSRAEATISARVRAGGVEIPIIGQIDRLAVSADAVTIADFKSGAPRDLDATPEAYIGQLALYAAAAALLWPDRSVRALLVWTAGPRVLEIPPETLAFALAKVAGKLAGAAPAP